MADQMKHLSVPHYEGLTVMDILKNIGMKDDFRLYMTIFKEISKLPKQFIINVAFSIIGDPFAKWVRSQIEMRNEKVTKEKDLLIAMDPLVAQAFQNSTSVSVSSCNFIF